MKKLNLACGPVYLDGYINIDNKSHFPDIKVWYPFFRNSSAMVGVAKFKNPW